MIYIKDNSFNKLMELSLETKLPNQWKLWVHNNNTNNDWSMKTFKELYQINNIEDFWTLHNNWSKNGHVIKNHYFLMKDDVSPNRSDEKNINGGCWSFRVKINQAQLLWDDLALYLVTNNLSKIPEEINGITCNVKKNQWVVIKIWNSNQKNSSLKILNPEILNKWGLDIIYIAHLN
jgi:hypothetical protein